MGRLIKRQFFDFNIPPTTLGHLRSLVIISFLKTKKKHWKERKKITEVKGALQSTKENRSPKVEKLSGTQPEKKGEKKEKKQQQNLTKRSYTKCYEEQNHLNY